MSQIEQLKVTKRVVQNGTTYTVDAVLFRRAPKGAFGVIGRTPWQFGAHSSHRITPDPGDLLPEILDEVASEVNASEAE